MHPLHSAIINSSQTAMLDMVYQGAAAESAQLILIDLSVLYLCAGELGGSLSAAQSEASIGYEWKPSEDSTYFPGRQAAVLSHGWQVGAFGVVHPNVLEKFDIPYPVSALELNIEPFVFDQMYRPLQTHIQM